jgi:hypothetical protein
VQEAFYTEGSSLELLSHKLEFGKSADDTVKARLYFPRRGAKNRISRNPNPATSQDPLDLSQEPAGLSQARSASPHPGRILPFAIREN